MDKQQLTNIINHKINQLRHEIAADKLNNRSICTFDDTNTANNPNTETTPPNIFISFSKLKLTFEKLNNKRFSSYDNIPNIALKNLPPLYIYHYTILFNNCLNLNHFPATWKIAKIIELKKKGKGSTEPNSYRPISLLPNISKIFGTVVNNSINLFCTDNSILPETQFGFRHKH